MTQSPSNDYDRVAYPSMAHPQTFAEGLAIKAFLRGLDAAPPHRCRVLELGCGDGFNLAAMSVGYPESTYVGVDYSEEAIERGRRMLHEAGISRVRLETADIREVNTALGTFDYIIAHGVFSWVPGEVREALLQTIDRHLAPQGVAFVSYLALPGAHLREMMRTMMRFHTRAEHEPAAKVQQARALLQLLTQAPQEPNHFTNLLKVESTVIDSHTDEAFFHDELSDESYPLLFTDFLGQAAAHDLAFLSEAEYLVPNSNLTEEVRGKLRQLERNRVLLEQYLDFIEGRRFRQTLLCRKGRGESLALSRLDSLQVTLLGTHVGGNPSLSSEEAVEFRARRETVIRARRPHEKALMLELHEGPPARPVPVVLAAARQRLAAGGVAIAPDLDLTLRQYLIKAYVPGLLTLSWGAPRWATTVPERPRSSPLARWQIGRGLARLTSLTGPSVEIADPVGRTLIQLLDGTRDRASVLAGMRAFLTELQAAHPEAFAERRLPSPDAPELSQQLDASLTGLARIGLLVAD